MQRMHFPTWWMHYVVMEDAGTMKVDAVMLQWLQCPYSSMNVDAVPMQCMQCPTMWMQYVVMGDAVHKKLDAVILQCFQCALLFT